jgi:putative IMPACT (imprinted ancient) family translation regulator
MAVSYMYDIEEGSQRLNIQESHKMHDSTIDKNAEIQEEKKQASSYCTQYPIFISSMSNHICICYQYKTCKWYSSLKGMKFIHANNPTFRSEV